LDDADFFAGGMWRKTFFQCGTFGEVSVFSTFNDPRSACRIIENAVVSGADFSGAFFKQLNFENCYFPKASFSSAEVLDVTFTNCYLRDATFEDAEMVDVSFDRCLPQDADFSDVEVRRVTADLVTHAQILKTSPMSPGLVQSVFRAIRWQSFWPELKPDDKIDTSAEMMEPPATRRRDPFRRVIEQLSAAAPPDADDGLVDEAPESW
jgi:uncharacterized protein YjbI with pentapeptide repeats